MFSLTLLMLMIFGIVYVMRLYKRDQHPFDTTKLDEYYNTNNPIVKFPDFIERKKSKKVTFKTKRYVKM
jgi:hypothetical protein